MKKTLVLLSFVLAIASSAYAQNCPGNYLGTKTLYKYQLQKYTTAPVGYLPVFINHVGRHGARHLTKEVQKTYTYAILLQADSANALTEKGKQLKQMVMALQKVEKGNTKSISAEGKNELYGIGQRMGLNYANVFKGKLKLDVAVTKEVRTTQSANAFLSGLNSKLKDTANVNFYNDDTDLRFYDLSPAYKKFENSISNCNLILSLKKAEDFTTLVDAVTGQFFNADFLGKIDQDQKEKLIDDIFGFSTIVYSLKAEIKQAGFGSSQLAFDRFFTCEQLDKLGRLDSAIENLEKGAGTNNNGIQIRVAAPLLVDFINSTDEFIKSGKYNARLRFAHAETTAPFAALLQISTADKDGKSVEAIQANWHSENVIPLSANIQWVFYKKVGKPGYLVKVLFNEKEAHIDGLDKKHFPYYNWSDIRVLYLAKLKLLGINLADDMNFYLSNIR
jgi:multiple inositol-polyphosphate phosphatase/2,3-bisphosphoglycerate 3-phosphatase